MSNLTIINNNGVLDYKQRNSKIVDTGQTVDLEQQVYLRINPDRIWILQLLIELIVVKYLNLGKKSRFKFDAKKILNLNGSKALSKSRVEFVAT